MEFVNIGVKLIFGLIALLVVTRLLGKKTMSQLTPFDFVYSIVLGGLLEESVYEDQTSLLQVGFAVAVWGLLLYGVEVFSQKSDKFRIMLKGEASILVKDGEFNIGELQKNHLEMEQVRTMLRQQGVFSLSEVKDLYLEPGGTFSVNKFKKYDPVTPGMLNLEEKEDPITFLIVDEGEINYNMIKALGKTEEWVHEQLEKEGYPNLKDILYAEWSEEQGFFVKTYQSESLELGRGN